MRVVAIPALLLLALAGLAVVPNAAAAVPEQPCNGTGGGGKTVGPVTVFASPPCYTVSVDPGCVYDDWYSRTIQRITVRINVCDAPTPPPTATQSGPEPQPCNCPPPQCVGIDTAGDTLRGLLIVQVQDDCDVYVIPLSSQECDGHKTVTQGRIHVIVPMGCDLPQPCQPPYFGCTPGPIGISSAVLIPPVCIWKEVAAGPVKAGFDQCRESHETNTCSNGSPQRIHYYEQVGPVYGQIHFCFPHTPPPQAAAMANPFPTCVTAPCGPNAPSVNACALQAATPTSVGPTGLNLQRLAWGYDTSQCDIDVEPIGACAPPSGSTIERRIGPLDIRLLICEGGIGGIGDGWS